MIEKVEYQTPTLEIVEFEKEDIITESPSYSDGPGVDMGDWDW